jgi:hypothetical protein
VKGEFMQCNPVVAKYELCTYFEFGNIDDNFLSTYFLTDHSLSSKNGVPITRSRKPEVLDAIFGICKSPTKNSFVNCFEV